jgi:hypothetical protein
MSVVPLALPAANISNITALEYVRFYMVYSAVGARVILHLAGQYTIVIVPSNTRERVSIIKAF